jgi:hypothetical protein
MESTHPRYSDWLKDPLQVRWILYADRHEDRIPQINNISNKLAFYRDTQGEFYEFQFTRDTPLAEDLPRNQRVMFFRRPVNTTQAEDYEFPFDDGSVYTLVHRETRELGPRISVLEYIVQGFAATGYVVVQLH